jgi:hypothetical protein
VAGGRANEEVRLADDFAFLAIQIDDGGEAPLVDGGDSLGKEAERFPFSLAPILGRREVRDVGRGGQRFEIPGLVLLSQPSERLFERAGALLLDTVSTTDAKPAPGGPVVVEDVCRDETNQFWGGRSRIPAVRRRRPGTGIGRSLGLPIGTGTLRSYRDSSQGASGFELRQPGPTIFATGVG